MLFGCYEKAQEEKKEVVINKTFRDDSTFVIECRGWPNERLKGRARIESAKEAALMNAQFTSRDLFDKSVDVVKLGTIENYTIEEDTAVIHYVIKKEGLRALYRE